MRCHTRRQMAYAARHLTVIGELAGEYVLDEELPDGRLVIRPDTSAVAIRRRMGGEPITGEEFDRLVAEHGILPPDDEG
jgi:hypothetical protein